MSLTPRETAFFIRMTMMTSQSYFDHDGSAQKPPGKRPKPANRRAGTRSGRCGIAQACLQPRDARPRRRAHHRAAMDELIARGFAATRLDDRQARRRRQGTIYLHFKDKESMFEELIRTASCR